MVPWGPNGPVGPYLTRSPIKTKLSFPISQMHESPGNPAREPPGPQAPATEAGGDYEKKSGGELENRSE